MKRSLTNSLLTLASAGLLLPANETKAAIATYTASHSPSRPDWSDSFALQEFNPGLGSLQSVYILVTSDVNVISGTIYNSGPCTESFSFSFGAQFTVTLPGTLGFLQASPVASAEPFVVASGATAPYEPAYGSANTSITYTSPGDMASFIGTGALSLAGNDQGHWYISGGDGYITPTAVNKLAGATVEVQYTYHPVPEPGSFALLALGGAVMLLRKRR